MPCSQLLLILLYCTSFKMSVISGSSRFLFRLSISAATLSPQKAFLLLSLYIPFLTSPSDFCRLVHLDVLSQLWLRIMCLVVSFFFCCGFRGLICSCAISSRICHISSGIIARSSVSLWGKFLGCIPWKFGVYSVCRGVLFHYCRGGLLLSRGAVFVHLVFAIQLAYCVLLFFVVFL